MSEGKIKAALPAIKRFTIESVSKYAFRKHKDLVEILFLYPNFGKGFKIFTKSKIQDYYIIDHANVKNNQHGKVYGMYYRNGIAGKKIIKLSNNLKEGRWIFDPPVGKYRTVNGVEYDLHKIQNLIEIKNDLLDKRTRILQENKKEICESSLTSPQKTKKIYGKNKI